MSFELPALPYAKDVALAPHISVKLSSITTASIIRLMSLT